MSRTGECQVDDFLEARLTSAVQRFCQKLPRGFETVRVEQENALAQAVQLVCSEADWSTETRGIQSHLLETIVWPLLAVKAGVGVGRHRIPSDGAVVRHECFDVEATSSATGVTVAFRAVCTIVVEPGRVAEALDAPFG